MIECIFTVDYEIYGNGQGSLKDLVYDPMEGLRQTFMEVGCRLVVFVEAAEIEMIESEATDPWVHGVKEQISELKRDGFELGLHLHPQWYNGRFQGGRWKLDVSEYNLCLLPEKRIEEIVDRSIRYLGKVVETPDFSPVSFRAGNWLLQPTATVPRILASRGIAVDSSVFKGGLQRKHGLDYRRAPRKSYYWKCSDHVELPDPDGVLLEIPIHTKMVPSWKMVSRKRVRSMRKPPGRTEESVFGKMMRLLDFLRPLYPQKFDFCRMTLEELKTRMEEVLAEDDRDPLSFKPVVLIGHTKDLMDLETIWSFLTFLREKGIRVSTFSDILPKCSVMG